MIFSGAKGLVLLASIRMAMVPVSGQADLELAPVTSMDAGSFHTVVIIRDSAINVVKAWGANGKGQVSEMATN